MNPFAAAVAVLWAAAAVSEGLSVLGFTLTLFSLGFAVLAFGD